MAWTVIRDDTLRFNRPLASATMRALRDNITRVYLGNQITVSIPKVSFGFGLSYCRATIASVAPVGGTILGVQVVNAPNAIGGTLVSFRANPNNAGGLNISAVLTGENSRVEAVIIPILGQHGGLST